MTNVPFVRFFLVVATVLASILSLATAQTAPAPVSTPASPAPTPSTPAHPTGQIVPGTTGTISPAQGVTPSTVAKAKANKILNSALTKETRKTLQEAMNAVTPPSADASAPANVPTLAVTNAPPADAGH